METGAQLGGDKNLVEFAGALDAGFRSGGWPGALRKGIQVSLAQRKAKAEYVSPYGIAPAIRRFKRSRARLRVA